MCIRDRFTFLSHEEINKLEEKVKTEPEKREAQKALASEVVRFLHGEEELQEAIKLTECLFTGNVKELTDEEIEMVFKGMPTIEAKEDTIINIILGLVINILSILLASSIEVSILPSISKVIT